MFQEESYDENQISSSTKEIIQEFKHIKKNLNSKEKNELLDKVNEIVARCDIALVFLFILRYNIHTLIYFSLKN